MDWIILLLNLHTIKLEEVCAGPLVCEGVEAFVVVDALRQREPDTAVVELLHLRPTARRRLDNFHFDDLNNGNNIKISITRFFIT